MRLLTTAIVAVCMLSACARATSAGPQRGSANLLSSEQLAGTNSMNLFDAISKLRPDWLNSRGPTSMTNPTPTLASVYMGGTNLGKTDYLRQVAVLDVAEVRFWDAARASARFGQGHPRGVIELIRR